MAGALLITTPRGRWRVRGPREGEEAKGGTGQAMQARVRVRAKEGDSAEMDR